ncbi:hypothetical protein V501_01530 [Pseudogymnoascus sp. VKM F-4519 (FW-2642)]|nr:hypothetical protein V501_01530 [Pseudogymnoascus sp. VKM F-4519 (FW-2642)]
MSAEFVPVAQNEVGLDRTRVNAVGQIALVGDSFNKSIIKTPGGSSDHKEDYNPFSKRKFFSKIAKKAIHINGKSSNSRVIPTAPILAEAKDTLPNATRLVHDLPVPEKTTIKKRLQNPVDTVKSVVAGQGGHQAASNLLAKEVSHRQEVELVKAHDEVLTASSEAVKLLAVKELGALMKARQDQYVRWTMDRHVTKVRLRPHGTVKKNKRDFVLLRIIYLIVHRKLQAPTIEDMRKDIMQIEDATKTAMTLSEFVEKRGDEAWVNSLIEQLGPWMFTQLANTANTMEVLRNFYEWRVPCRTAGTVGLLTVVLFVVTLTPTWLLVRSITLIIGIVFFALFPISSRFQDYRLLASPFVWIFWKIPTHAEWSIKSLQAEGARHRRLEPNPPDLTSDQHMKQEPDPLGYRGPPTNAGETGLTRAKFKPTTAEITRQAKRALSSDSRQDLMVAGLGDKQYLLLDMAQRDQAFSQIVGFADVTWQVVW